MARIGFRLGRHNWLDEEAFAEEFMQCWEKGADGKPRLNAQKAFSLCQKVGYSWKIIEDAVSFLEKEKPELKKAIRAATVERFELKKPEPRRMTRLRLVK